MIKRYKTKPCEIEAIQFTKENWKEIQNFTNGEAKNFFITQDKEACCEVVTLEGTMIATEGDYIIRGLRGEYYPCKPDVFEKKYEVIEQ